MTGHESDRNLEIYLQGVENYALARDSQEKLADRFGGVIKTSLEGANTRRFSGATGRAAAKARREAAEAVSEGAAKHLPTYGPPRLQAASTIRSEQSAPTYPALEHCSPP